MLRNVSYTILIYRCPVLRHKSQQTLVAVPAPVNVLEGCFTDVSLMAGLMVDQLFRTYFKNKFSGMHRQDS
jgi:hypothetical protein